MLAPPYTPYIKCPQCKGVGELVFVYPWNKKECEMCAGSKEIHRKTGKPMFSMKLSVYPKGHSLSIKEGLLDMGRSKAIFNSKVKR